MRYGECEGASPTGKESNHVTKVTEGGGELFQLSSCLWFVQGARSEFWGVASRVPWGWLDSYGKTGNFGRVGDKSMFKMYKKAGVGREGDI